MIANDIRICQYRDAPAKEERDDVARLMEASRAISQIIVMRLQQDSVYRVGGWSSSTWLSVIERIKRTIQELEEGELEKE